MNLLLSDGEYTKISSRGLAVRLVPSCQQDRKHSVIDGAAGLAAVALLSLNKKMGILNSTLSLAWVVNGSTKNDYLILAFTDCPLYPVIH
jgi:hypothetical protein